jgi:MscS family membrane protein
MKPTIAKLLVLIGLAACLQPWTTTTRADAGPAETEVAPDSPGRPVGDLFEDTREGNADAAARLIEHVPEPLRRMGPAGLRWWQWLALPALALLCAVLGRLLAFLTRRILVRMTRATEVSWDDALVLRMTGPIALLWAVLLGYLASPSLLLNIPAERKLDLVLRSGATVALFWAVLRSIDLAGDLLARTPTMGARSARALLPVLTRIAKVAVLVLLAVAVLSGFGLPVASLIAGLGVGGIAFALAAQKTVENVFGAVSIGIDVPFNVGDFIKVDGVVGTIEAIGLRSTRIRTLDRTLVTLPNGGLADSRIESYTARDRIRLATVIGLEYGTTEAQMRSVLEGLEASLRAHSRIWPDNVIVRFIGFGASSLDIEIMAWFLTQDWNEFTAMRQQQLLEFMAIVERNGTSFAFPTQTLHLQGLRAPTVDS